MPGQEVQSVANDISVSKTRPDNTTGYTALDVVGAKDTGTAANAGDAIWTFAGVPERAVLEGVSLRIDVADIPSGMTTFRVHLYKSQPTAILDNAAWSLIAGDRTAYLGYVDLATPLDLVATLWTQADSVNKRIMSTGGTVYAMLQTIGAYTPSALTVKTLTLRVSAA
jgi:hypothetical protein